MRLTTKQLDALREISNIGAGHAAIALSQILNNRIMIAVIRSDLIPLKTFLNKITDNTKAVVSVYIKTISDVEGVAVNVFKLNSALRLSDKILGRQSSSENIDKKGQSAIKEAANILVGAFFSVIADMLSLNVLHYSPNYIFDNTTAIINRISQDTVNDINKDICFTTEFVEKSNEITGFFAFIPTKETINILLEKLNLR